MTIPYARYVLPLLVLTLMPFVVSCGDGPLGHEDDVHVHGMIIDDSGTPVVTDDDGFVTGSITLDAGDETPDYTFTFVDHDGDPITSGLDAFTLEATVDDTGVAIFHSTADFEAHFQGISAGSTTVVISLVHTADGDEHYVSPAIDVTVN